jgi:hypothetical protein
MLIKVMIRASLHQIVRSEQSLSEPVRKHRKGLEIGNPKAVRLISEFRMRQLLRQERYLHG